MFDAEFWVAVAFVIFVALIWRPAARTISQALDSRAQKIKDELEEAVRLREEAQALYAAQQRRYNESVKETEAIVAQAREEAERAARHGAEELSAQLARREQQAMERIARAEQEALAEVKAAAVDLGIRATRAVLAATLDAKAQGRLADEAIAEVEKKLH